MRASAAARSSSRGPPRASRKRPGSISEPIAAACSISERAPSLSAESRRAIIDSAPSVQRGLVTLAAGRHPSDELLDEEGVAAPPAGGREV
ncbi:MAG: hypothetical protein M5U28_51090, partial [Sandaracinaceae bacterium]|nr:hypothetical protein [Sandaracinaceae bacterium]